MSIMSDRDIVDETVVISTNSLKTFVLKEIDLLCWRIRDPQVSH